MNTQPPEIEEWEAEKLRLAKMVASGFSVIWESHGPGTHDLYLGVAERLMLDRGWVKPEPPKLVTAGERIVETTLENLGFTRERVATDINSDLTRLMKAMHHCLPKTFAHSAAQVVREWRDGKIGGDKCS